MADEVTFLVTVEPFEFNDDTATWGIRELGDFGRAHPARVAVEVQTQVKKTKPKKPEVAPADPGTEED